MPEETKSLPPVVVPKPFFDLVRLYAFRNEISVSEAVRQLLKESPPLAALAQEQGVELSSLAVGSWGGNRK
jgi:hypothetical protein